MLFVCKQRNFTTQMQMRSNLYILLNINYNYYEYIKYPNNQNKIDLGSQTKFTTFSIKSSSHFS